MIFGFMFIVVGYALFYWGWHHFNTTWNGGDARYSLWALLGFGTLWKSYGLTPGQAVGWGETPPPSPPPKQQSQPAQKSQPNAAQQMQQQTAGGGILPTITKGVGDVLKKIF